MSDQAPAPAGAPNYVRPTAASLVADSSTAEQDRVRNAFHPCSYTSISSLPTNIGHDFATRSRASAVEGYGGPTGMRCGKAPEFFTEFEYAPEPYSLAEELASEERRQKIKQAVNVGGKPFVAPGVVRQGKYEGNPEYVSDPYESYHDDALRRKWLEEKKALAGPFVPAGAKGPLEKPTRAMLTDMMTHLYRILSEDWEEAQPTVFTTEEDLIVIYFNVRDIRNPEGIKSYMNVLVQQNESLGAYDLRRVVEGWGKATEDHHLMFALRPPWVKPKNFTTVGGQGDTSGASP